MNLQNSTTNRPASTLLPNEQEISFDYIHRFFNKYRPWIIGLSLAVVLAIAGIAAWHFQEGQIRRQADDRLAAAHSIGSLQAVVRDFSGTDAALIASVMLADICFQQGNWDQAEKCYKTMVECYPTSSLVPSALIGLAAIDEAKGRLKEAIQTYQSLVSNFPNSFQAPQAQFAVARLQESEGQFQEARKSYEELLAKYPGSGWKGESTLRLRKIEFLIKSKSLPPGT